MVVNSMAVPVARYDTGGIRAPAGGAKRIAGPSPWPPGHGACAWGQCTDSEPARCAAGAGGPARRGARLASEASLAGVGARQSGVWLVLS